MGEISLIGLIGVIGLIGAMMVGVVVDKGDGRGLWGQGCVFADFMRSCWLSDGCGRCRRPCPRLLHGEPCRLAVVTAFSLKLAMALVGAEGGSEHSAGVAAAAVGAAASATSVADSEHSEHSAGVDAGADAEGASVVTAGAAGDSEHSAGVGAGAGAVSVGGGVAAARIWAR